MFAIALVVYGISVHVVPADQSAESDGYLAAAERVRDGVWEAHRFHPLLYPTVVGGVAVLFDDCLFAARLVSTACAAFALWATYRLGALVGSVGVGVASALLLACCAPFVVHGVLASSDMMFLCLLLFLLGSAVRLVQDPQRTRRAFAMGLWFGAAWSTRYVAIIALVPMTIAVWRADRRLRAGFFAAAGIALAAAPQFWLNARDFGSGTYNELWRNLYLKLDGNFDWGLLTRPVEVEGWLDVIGSDPGGAVRGFAEQIQAAFFTVLPKMWGGGVLGAAIVGALGLAALLRAVPIRTRRPFATTPGLDVVWAFGLVYVVVVASTFYSTPRLLLPVLPLQALLVSRLCYDSVWRSVFARATSAVVLAAVVHFAVLALVVSGGAPSLRKFEQSHSRDVWDAMRWIEARGEASGIVVGDHPEMAAFFRRYVHESVGMGAGVGHDEYLRALDALCRASDVRYLLFSEKWIGERPPALLRGEDHAIDFLRFVHRAGSVVIYEPAQ